MRGQEMTDALARSAAASGTILLLGLAAGPATVPVDSPARPTC